MPQQIKDINHFKSQGIDLSKILYKPNNSDQVDNYNTETQNHNLNNVLDFKILNEVQNSINEKEKINLKYFIKNTDRTIGAILSNEISKIYGSDGLPENTINIHFTGTAGQSFGAFSAKGLSLKLEGTANDYFGKGLSGATLIAKVPNKATFIANKNIIIGNVALYGATSGEVYINGIAGERFCVRNSGATAIVEGIGDHGCEYMTGGIAIILGDFGRNFAAGMSGGIAYLYNKKGVFDEKKFNLEMVELESLKNDDIKTLKKIIQNHLKYTNSSVAKNILNSWAKEIKNFIKVMPSDYKKALKMIKKQKSDKIM